jgi:hypothetical protein
MKHQSGINTIINGVRYRYQKDTKTVTLFSDGFPIPGFLNIGDNVFKKTVGLNVLENSFYFVFKCRIGKHIFIVRAFLPNGELDASTDSQDAANELKIPAYDRNEYIKTFHFSELDAIWEERSESPDGLPFPEGLARIEYLKGGPGDL